MSGAAADRPARRRAHRAGAEVIARIPHARARRVALNRWNALLHLGRRVRCPLCGWSFARFADAANRADAICWRCGSHERHRTLWLFLRARPSLLRDAGSLLHFAPEWCLEHRLRRVPGLRYVTADLEPGLGELQLDVTRIALPDGAFGAILCSHVLEHVPDDRAAMRELRRVLAPGGWLIVMVPLDHSREETYEDPAITAPAERERAFWQHDHVRLYAPDIAGRLAEAGLDVTRHRPPEVFPPTVIARYGLLDVDDVLLCVASLTDARGTASIGPVWCHTGCRVPPSPRRRKRGNHRAWIQAQGRIATCSWRSALREPVSSPRRPKPEKGVPVRMSTAVPARSLQAWPEALWALPGDGWAILADPPGVRDLGSPELWRRSLARSRRRRAAAAAERPNLHRTSVARVSAALIAATVAAPVAQVAEAQTTTATAASSASLLKKGSRGASVAAAQRVLGIPADGVFGPQTRRAVKAFQRSHGLVPDGVIGPLTAGAMGLTGGGGGGTARTVASSTPSNTTMALQQKLGIPADGVYGPQTRAAVRAFQQRQGLIVDGVAGPQTLGALGLAGAAPIPAASVTPVAASSGASAAVAAARSKLGAPYVSAGTGPTGFDCSGLTQWAMRQAGVSLPRTSFSQFGVGTPVSRAAIQAGDLVFFNANGPGASHVGIATGPGTAISATTHGVREHAIGDSYWGSHYVGARRVA